MLIDYSEKLWGLPAHLLSPSVATRRLSGMTIKSLAMELLGLGATAHLDGEFLYPEEGFGAIVEALGRRLPDGAVLTNSPVLGLERQGGRITSVIHAGGRLELSSDHLLISTLPLAPLVRLFQPPLETTVVEIAGSLRFRDIRLLYFRLAQERFSRHASIYFPDRDLWITRLSEPKNRSPRMAPAHETGIVVETPCFVGDDIHRMPAPELARQVLHCLSDRGLLDPGRVLAWRHHLLPNAYPVYDLAFQDRVETVARALSRYSPRHVAING